MTSNHRSPTIEAGQQAATTLGGLLAYSVAGLWWADPPAGLIVVGFALREGWEAWHSELWSD